MEKKTTPFEEMRREIIYDAKLTQRERRLLLLMNEIAFCEGREEMDRLVDKLRREVEGPKRGWGEMYPNVGDSVPQAEWDGHNGGGSSVTGKIDQW